MDSPIPFAKYHALGNDYIVLAPDEFGEDLTGALIRLICHRNYGIGSDGILCGPFDDDRCDFGLRIYNPDGSEAEKSGNGLRIFARYLWDTGLVSDRPVTIKTAGGPVEARVDRDGSIITVAMGQVSFDSRKIPVAGSVREVINETIEIKGRTADRNRSALSQAHQCPVHANPGSVQHRHRNLGTRRRIYAGIGQQQQRGGGRRPPPGSV
jgi:diaminopimelate epimerase